MIQDIKRRLFISDSVSTDRAVLTTSLSLTALNILSRTVGLFIPIVIARWYGVSNETDSFFFAYSIILFVTGIFSVVAETVIVPFVAELRVSSSEGVQKFLEEVTAMGAVIIVVVTVLVVVAIEPVMNLATKFSEGEIFSVRQLLVEASILPVIVLFASVYSGALNTHHRYGIPVASQALRSIIAIAVILFFRRTFGIHAIIAGYVLGELSRMFLVATYARRYGIISFSLRLRVSQQVRVFFSVALFHILSMLAMGLTPVTDKFVSSWLPPGSVSVIEYANKLYFIPVTLATSGFTVVLLSHWSNKHYRGTSFDLWADTQKSCIIIGIAGVIMTLVSLMIAPIVIEMFMNLKANSSLHFSQVLGTFRAYIIGLTPYALSQVYVRGLLVMKQTKNIFLIALVLNAVNIVFDIVFMNMVGVWGIALSTSLVSICSWVLHLLALRRVTSRQSEVAA